MGVRTAAPWLALAVALCVADQLTKHWASSTLIYGIAEPVWPGFNLTLLHNTGAAFSLFSDQAGWQRWFFSAIAVFISGVVVVWLCRLQRGQLWSQSALAMILGGAIGNLVDRINLGYVVDFIQLYYDSWYWPAFNLADSAITTGAIMLIFAGSGTFPGSASADEANQA